MVLIKGQFWRNEALTGKNEVLMGGVGWMVHRSLVDKVQRAQGPLEGPHAMWIQTQGEEGQVQWASLYVRPTDKETQQAFVRLMMEDAMAGNGKRVVLGDVNCNTATVGGDEAGQWREMFEMRDMVALDQVGDWA